MARFLQRSLCGLLLAVLTIPAGAAPFAPPAEVVPPFRRDRIPLDSAAMASLAKSLATLTEGGSLETPPRRRAAAQALALALALDPSNAAARRHLATLEEGGDLPDPGEERLAKAKARIWQTISWFAAPEAGEDGNLLAALAGDVLSVLDPEHPASEAMGRDAGRKQWDGWIAPLAAFTEKPVKIAPPDPVVSDLPEEPDRNEVSVVLKKARLSTVLNSYDKDLRLWSPELTTVNMEASEASSDPESEDGGDFRIEIPGRSSEEDRIDSRVARPILEAMEEFLGSLPERGTVRLLTGSDGNYAYRQNRSLLTGPGFLLAAAAASGTAPEGIVIAELDERSAPALPDHFWRLLMVLSDDEKGGGRLVLPAGAEEYLVSFLALEDPDFFLRHEVLLASSAAEFVALTSGKPSDEHSAVFGKFAEIVEKAEGNPTGVYLANRFVRQRLQEIIDAAPYHLSAKLLARQGAGMRPRYLSKKVLAAEIWRSVDLVSELSKMDIFLLDSGQVARLEELYEEMRGRIDALERYAESRDRDLLKEGKDLTMAVRNLARKMRSRSDDFFEDGYSDISEARREMVSRNEELLKKLSEISGDPLPGGRAARNVEDGR